MRKTSRYSQVQGTTIALTQRIPDSPQWNHLALIITDISNFTSTYTTSKETRNALGEVWKSNSSLSTVLTLDLIERMFSLLTNYSIIRISKTFFEWVGERGPTLAIRASTGRRFGRLPKNPLLKDICVDMTIQPPGVL